MVELLAAFDAAHLRKKYGDRALEEANARMFRAGEEGDLGNLAHWARVVRLLSTPSAE
ncbi:hypothetical protein PQ455_07475 [Sphingomonas naphthae]|uniref:Uncharacterized protein n=1 Tax=Sphingomonas naphthae TaxID=1813468 RepID=A0ABY7TP81_9SPHN|nr:hypothetical protein [Sphingomonas naphthae]WCT75046.1 hypothetical protein PQ455_07475 [Sphingomonas naphthae]